MTPEERAKTVRIVYNDQSVEEPVDDAATEANIAAAIRAAVEDARAELDRLKADYIETTLAVLRERERCAKVAESTDIEGDYHNDEDGGSYWESDAEKTRAAIARRIREGTP